MQYTESQNKAINTTDKNLQIIACAGSGKTQVISERIARIIESGVEPISIVAFTYTEKAAAELQSRILRLVKEKGIEVKGLSEMYVGTIHAWCLRVLQDHKYEFQKYTILNEIRLKLFIDKNFKRIGMQELNMERFKDTGIFIGLMTILRESDLNPDVEIPSEVSAALEKYEACLHDNAYFDFTMIMCKTVELLKEDPEFQARIGKHLRYLVVDEYQDVNPIQEQIVRCLADMGANVCVVGDDDQTLYEWRGSDNQVIQGFRDRYEDVEYIKLEDNFRSSHGIIDVAQKCILNNSKRLDKAMIAKGHQKYEKGDILYNQFNNTEEEYNFIAHSIANLRGVEFEDKKGADKRGLDYSDFVILLRTWKKAEGITETLEAHGIPFIVAGVNNLFLTSEVQAARSIYHYLDGQVDEETLVHLWTSLSDKIVEAEVRRAIGFLDTKFPEDNAYYERFNLQEIFHTFLELAGIREGCFVDENGGQNASGYLNEEIVFYNLGMFSQIIDDFESIYFKVSGPYKLNTFLSFLRYSAEGYYPEGWLNNSYKTPNAIQIMTVYQSKGLEYPVVIIPGLNRNYLPIKRPGGRQVWHYLKRDLILNQARYELDGDYEDERRLMYVAITRSKKFLLISRAPEDSNRLYQRESPFGAEIRASDYVFQSKTRDYSERPKLDPRPTEELGNISLNFSLLKAYFDCPYSFKFYSFYGFRNPLGARIGYGKSIHNTLMEIHREYLEGKQVGKEDIPGLLTTHMHFPYATEPIKADMSDRAHKSVNVYMDQNAEDFKNIEFAEKDIQLDLGEGILVSGRMDLIKKRDLDGNVFTTIIDFKSSENTQDYQTSHDQLALYALGYQEISGEKADFLEIYNLDENKPYTEELLVSDMKEIREKIVAAANAIRHNDVNHTCSNPDCVCKKFK